MKIDMKVNGLDKLVESFNTDKKRLALKATVKKYAADVQRGAVRRVPVDTGFLKRSIQSPSFSLDGMYAVVRATAEYAPYQEYGTRFMSAQPFMAPAYNEIRQDFLDSIQRVVSS